MRRFFWSRRRIDADTRREFEAHLDELADRYVRAGMTAEAARAAARRQLGNVTLVREDIHHMNGWPGIDGLSQDLQYAFRQIRRSPGFSAVIVATLALGRWLSSLTFEVSPSDPRILVATAAVLAVAGLLAAWLPARRASRIQPAAVIRQV